MVWAIFLLIVALVWLVLELLWHHWCWTIPAGLMAVLALFHLVGAVRRRPPGDGPPEE